MSSAHKWKKLSMISNPLFKMSMVPNKNIFSILETYGADLAPHVVFILKTSGYISFRAISKITEDKISSIENFIRTLFADETLTNELSKEQKMSQFGPLYWNKPENFTFTLGDNDSIQAAVEVSQKLIEGQTLPTLTLPQPPIFQHKKTVLRNVAQNSLKEAKKTLAETSILTEPQIQGNEKFTQSKKSLMTILTEWLEKHEEINFDKTKWTFDESKGFVNCGQCKVKINISLNEQSGQFRISNVTRHLSVSITLISKLLLTQELCCFINFRICTTKRKKTVKDVEKAANFLWRDLRLNNKLERTPKIPQWIVQKVPVILKK